MNRPRPLRAAGALALVALAGCARPARDLRPVLDLAAELPGAAVEREVREIDFGSPAAAPHLLDGWSWREREAGTPATTWVWGVGSASRLRLFLVEPRDLRLELRGRAARLPDGPQVVTVRAGGREVGRVSFEADGWSERRLAVPAARLRAGWNTFELGYRRALAPRRGGRSRDRRELAMAWDRLRLGPAVAAGPGPAALPARTRGGRPAAAVLRLPPGSAVAYARPIPTGAAFALAGLRGAGRLAVDFQWEGGAAVEIARLEEDRGGSLVALPAVPGGRRAALGRLTLRALPRRWDRAPAGSALELSAPRILAPPAATPPPEPAATAPRREAPAPRPNVLVYLVDTLRADRVGVYGSDRGLTPEVDRFARGAVVFGNAVTQAPWTRPAVASVLTGLPPLRHGVTTLESRLADAAVTLPEILRDLPGGGYRTAAWSTNWHVIRQTGLAQGFDDFFFFPEGPPADVVGASVVAWLDRWLAAGAEGDRRPFFLYVHVLDPHAPYLPPDDLRRRFAAGVAHPEAGSREFIRRVYAAQGAERARLAADLPPLYDAEVAHADRCFGELLAALAARGLRDDTLVVFLSDHGEEFDEHGDLGHGNNLHAESLRIPLVIDRPGDAPGRDDGLALPMDVPATVLAALGVAHEGMAGVDLFAGAGRAGRAGFAHLDYDGRVAASVVQAGWKLIVPWSAAAGRFPALYDLRHDPGERHDLAAADPVRAAWLRGLVRRHRRAAAAAGDRGERLRMDPELRRGLEALGYL